MDLGFEWICNFDCQKNHVKQYIKKMFTYKKMQKKNVMIFYLKNSKINITLRFLTNCLI